MFLDLISMIIYYLLLILSQHSASELCSLTYLCNQARFDKKLELEVNKAPLEVHLKTSIIILK